MHNYSISKSQNTLSNSILGIKFMKNSDLTIQTIKSKFRSGDNTAYIYSNVLPLFVHGSTLFNNYNEHLKNEFLSALQEAGVNESDSIFRWNTISEIIVDGYKGNLELTKIEEQLLAFYRPLLKPERTIINQTVRNERCYQMVQEYILGESVLDYGCGKGLLGEKIKAELKKKVVLVDTIDFNKSELPLSLIDSNGLTKLESKTIDTSIAYLVLHHMNNPFSGLNELSRVTKSRIILMEGYIEKEEYLHINQTIDWFFNRILLGVNMNVPLNFLKLTEWEVLIEEVGFKISKIQYVGADEKLAPEHHVLIIADRV